MFVKHTSGISSCVFQARVRGEEVERVMCVSSGLHHSVSSQMGTMRVQKLLVLKLLSVYNLELVSFH